MAEEKQAKKVYSLEEIRYNEENKVMAILACIPLIGLILLFVEKKDLFVRYMGAQYTVLGAIQLVLGIIPVVGWALSGPFSIVVVIFIILVSIVVVIFIILGMVKVAKGERYDLPVLSKWGLKLMGTF